MVDAYNCRDIDRAFAEFLTPDFEWYPGLVRAFDGGGYRGREGVERFAVDWGGVIGATRPAGFAGWVYSSWSSSWDSARMTTAAPAAITLVWR